MTVQWRFDAVSIRRPTWGWRKATRDYWLKHHRCEIRRRALGRLGRVADDRRPNGDEVLVMTVPPTMSATPPHAFAQIDAPDLAAFDLDPSLFGGLG